MTKLRPKTLSAPCALLLFGLGALLVGSPSLAQDYLGSDACASCHGAQHNEWIVSGHPWKIVSSDVAQNREAPLPQPPLPAGPNDGLTWDDVTYIIGGYKWKIRYIGTDGYIITSVDTDGDGVADTDGMNQYNMLTGEWVDYHPGELKPYNCGSCHTTGWIPDEDWETDNDLSDNQDGLPGMHGTFAFGGIQCEACHGPRAHFSPDYMGIDDSAAACGACHIRGDPLTIPAKGGFIRHHEQWNEQLASPHYALKCVSCHNPHKKSEWSIERDCETCHSDVAESYADTEMGVFGVECIDCHMPFASKSAAALGPFRGDVRTHLFAINTDANANLFTEDGSFVLLDEEGQAGVTLDFACLSCHRGENLSWAEDYADNFHDLDDGSDDSDSDSDSDSHDGKVAVCHNARKPLQARTIWVSPRALGGHLRHGDTMGRCGDIDSLGTDLTALPQRVKRER